MLPRLFTAVVGILIMVGMLLLSGCSVLTPAQRAVAVRQAAFLAIPMEERSIILSDEIENTLVAMMSARRVLRKHWDAYSEADKVEFEMLDLRSRALIPMAQAIADSSGVGQTMNLRRIVTRGERIYREIDALVLKNRELYSMMDLVTLADASADIQVFYDLAMTAYGAGQKVDTARAVLNIVKATVGVVL